MTRAKFDGKLFIVSHYQEPFGNGNDLNNTSSKPDSPKIEPQPEAKSEPEPKGILTSPSSTSLSRTSTNAPTPIQYPTPPASTFKQVKWLDSPTVKTPISRSQTPGGHTEDSDTEYITASASASATNNNNRSSKSPNTLASTSLKAPAPRHTVTHHWQEHILLEDPFPGRRWPPGPGRHGNDRAHTRSMPEGGGGDDYYEKAEPWHISAKELEMSLEKYEREGRRSARRKQRTQSVYLPVPEYDNDDDDEEEEYEWGQEEDRNYTYTYTYNNNGKDRINTMKAADKSALPFRRWSDVHRLAAQIERSPSTTSEATELGRFGRLGVGK